MKKKVALIVLAVTLLAAGLAGGVYAVNGHQSVQGEKLVGVGTVGTVIMPWGAVFQNHAGFWFTNPDCVKEITIKQVSIISADGTVIYEGPYIRVMPGFPSETREIVTEPMSPHEIWGIFLPQYMCLDYSGNLTDPYNWLTIPDAIGQPVTQYTVEISWKAKGSVCPLIGWYSQHQTAYDAPGPPSGFRVDVESQSQMVNLKQRIRGR